MAENQDFAIVYSPAGTLFSEDSLTETAGDGLKLVAPIEGGGIVSIGDPRQLEALAAAGNRVKLLPDTNILRVRDIVIDTTGDEPELPSGLRLSATARKTWTHHVLQLVGPPLPEFIDQLAAAGVEVVRQIDRYAVHVTGDADAVERARELNIVTWAGPLEPAYRVAPALLQQRGTIPIRVGIYSAAAADEVRKAAEEIGMEIHAIDRPDPGARRAGPPVLRGTVSGVARIRSLAKLSEVSFIESDEPDILYDERSAQIVYEDLDAAPAPGTAPNTGYAANLTALGINGTGVTIAVIDSGVDNHNSATAHQDLQGRLAFFADQTGGATTTDMNGHGTHVAGIAAGNGATGDTDPQGFVLGQGVAPGSQIGSYNRLAANPQPTAQSNMQAAAAAGAEVNNNSWGTSAPQGYSARCGDIDQIVRDPDPAAAGFQEMAIVFALGNAGGLSGSMGGPTEAKNIITVGNSLNRRPGERFLNDDIRGIAPSSSRGPTADNRIVPTVVAPGTDIVSARSTVDTNAAAPGVQRPGTAYTDTAANVHQNHTALSGTSMAAPHVSGLCALLIEWWRDRTGRMPSPAMLKALLVNGAEDLAGGPNFKMAFDPSGANAWTANGNRWQFTGLGFQPTNVWGFGSANATAAFTQLATAAQVANPGDWSYAAGTDTLTVRSLGGTAPDTAATAVNWDRVFVQDPTPLQNIPNNDQGWGRASLENMVTAAPESDRGPKIFSDQRIAFTANGQLHRLRVAPVDPARPMRVTLCWTDADGATLINDLDLVVTQPGGPTYVGNNFVNGFSAVGGLADSTNNVECVYIQNPSGVYDIDVVASAITTDARTFTLGSPWQDYALVIDNAQVPPADPVSVVTVLDRSGSMVTSGYVDRTRQASSQFVDLMGIDDAVGVASFAGTPSIDYSTPPPERVETITGDNERNAAKGAIAGLGFGGGTFMSGGIDEADTLLTGATGNRAIVLLSDGFENSGSDAAAAAGALDPDIALYTCAMGPASDQTLLGQLAAATGGRYYYMPTIDDLFEIYNWIRGRVTSTAVIANESSQASKSRVGAFVDACTDRVTFTVAWSDPNVAFTPHDLRRAREVSIRLRTPNGKQLPASSSLMRTVRGAGYVAFELQTPAPGLWFVEVETKRDAHLPYTVGAFAESDIETTLVVSPDPALPGQPLNIDFAAWAHGKPIDDLRAEVCVFAPRIGQRTLLEKFGRNLRRRVRNEKGDAVPDRASDPTTIIRHLAKEGIDAGETEEHCFEVRTRRTPWRPTIIPDLTRPWRPGNVIRTPGSLVIGGGFTNERIADRLSAVTSADLLDRRLEGTKPAAVFKRTKETGTYNIRARLAGTSPDCGQFVRHEFASVRVGLGER